MRILIQRVQRAAVSVDGETVGAIGPGLVAFVGVGVGDDESIVRWMATKVAGLRIFRDENDRMNRSLLEVDGEVLVVSQFTLYGDCRRGRRPSFVHAAPGPQADRWVEAFAEELERRGVRRVAKGRFGAMMEVELVNDGPVTIWLEKEPD